MAEKNPIFGDMEPLLRTTTELKKNIFKGAISNVRNKLIIKN